MSTFNKSIVPAEAGYHAIDFQHRDGKAGALLLPVIAWAIWVGEERTTVTPICVDELSDLYEGAIMTPKGQVFIRRKESWENLEGYLDCVPTTWSTLVDIRKCAKQWGGLLDGR